VGSSGGCLPLVGWGFARRDPSTGCVSRWVWCVPFLGTPICRLQGVEDVHCRPNDWVWRGG
jgi:hypothetical protein